jgi:hypothetical protein
MDAVAAIIELSVAPVFLLAGIGALLTVLSNRLGRITDRARVLERRIATARSDRRSGGRVVCDIAGTYFRRSADDSA